MPRFCSFSPLKCHWMHPILKASRKILTSKYYDKFAFIHIRDSMGAHLIFFIIFTLFSCIILTNQSLPWYSLRSGFQCDTKMATVFSCMRPGGSMLISSMVRWILLTLLQIQWNCTLMLAKLVWLACLIGTILLAVLFHHRMIQLNIVVMVIIISLIFQMSIGTI